jgi:DNA (cytosine-5)-methyltransferase 1
MSDDLISFRSTGGSISVDASTETFPTLQVGSGLGIPSPPAVMSVNENQRGEVYETSVGSSLGKGGGKPGQGYPAVRSEALVRRLTPVECERLQGWPDGWTLLEGPSLVDEPRWFEEGYEPNEEMPAPDGRRYAACGDGVTATVAEWIGRRLRERM